MVDESDPRRDRLHEVLQEMGPPQGGPAVLTGWVVVSEWVDDQGERWLARGWAPSTTAWCMKGMLHEVLHGTWPDDEGG